MVLNLPLDVQAAPTDRPGRCLRCRRSPRSGPARTRCARSRPPLATAQRPVFVAGRGARARGTELRALAAASGALLATSAVAARAVRRRPVVAGDLRRVRHPAGRRADHRRRPGRRLGLRAEHVDHAPRRADRPGRHGSCRWTWTRTRSARTGRSTSACSATSARPPSDVLRGARRAAHRLPHDRGRRRDRRARPLARRAVRRPDGARRASTRARCPSPLDDLLPAERTVAVDSGNFMGYPSAYLRVPDEHGFCFTQGFQSIGLGLATAIGAALARPDRLTVAALGDGGALMGVAELETVVAAAAPDGRRGLRRPRLRRRGAPLHRRGPRHRGLPGHRHRRHRPGLRLRGRDRERPRRPRRRGPTGWPGPGTRRCWWTHGSPPTAAPGGWPRRSAGTDGRRISSGGTGG